MKKVTWIVFVVIVVSCASSSIQSQASPPAYPVQADELPGGGVSQAADSVTRLLADDPSPPASPVKLIFVHHSCGGNWLADPAGNEVGGDLGRTLMNNNYYVSATNYGWLVNGEDVGSNTDIGYWWTWFRGTNSADITQALYDETGQNIGDYGSWPRLASDPGGENVIVMFKSCFPNSALQGDAGASPPPIASNPLRDQPAEGNPDHTVANAKGIYVDLLNYFQTRQDKLFIVITAPPLIDGTWGANARAFNNWLVNDWLDGYAYNNVAVFDFYNVLTSNGGDVDTNDLGSASGNHHRWWNGAVQHLRTVDNNTAAYPSGDDHPNLAGNEKATGEFVQLLNVFYNRWKGGAAPTPSLTLTLPNGGESWPTGSQRQIRWSTTGTVAHINLYYSTDNFGSRRDIALNIANTNAYTWTTPITPSTSVKVRVESVISPTVYDESNANFTLYTPGTFDHFVYLPLVLKNYASALPTCPYPLTGVTISGPTSGSPSPSNIQSPISNLQSPTSPLAAQPTGLTALHRSGQTFLTWNENIGVSGEGYHVYRHTAPINASNIAQATRLTEKWGPLPEGSSIFYTDRDRDPAGSLFTGLQNYVITDLGAPLTDTVGLFVWTSKQSGNFYYAVTTVEAGGGENLTDFGSGNSSGAVAETVADPAPILVWQSSSGNGRVYTQFMDFETYNPTFERPYAHPEGGLQYAYNYFVGLPTPDQCGGSLPASLPVLLHIEGYGSRYVAEGGLGDQSSYFCAVEIWGDDPRQSWYYGFSATYDYRSGDPSSDPPSTGPIVNYAEARLLRSIYDTLRDSDYDAYHLDPQRVYVYGHSMGASGALALAMRYPNVFAASYSSEPMTNYRTAGDSGGDDWRNDLIPKWGTVAANLPISNVGRYAGHLATYNGNGVWDWQNHQANLVSRRGDEMAHISLAHGTLDTVIEWSTQGQPAYAPFYQGRRAFSGATLAADHTWIGWAGMGPNVGEVDYGPFYNFSVVRDESIPGLSNASGSSSAPPASNISATYNLNLEWSASWDDWDGAPVDTAGQWRISLRTTDDSNQTVDVTPRRLQAFSILPGANYAWENRRVSDNGLVASGNVAADAYGLVTVQTFAVSSSGNRLVLQPAGGPVPASLTLVSPNGGESWQAGSQHPIQWTSTGSIPNVSLSYSTDNFATSHIIVASTTNTGSYNWTTPITPSASMHVRVASTVSPTTVYDDSNASFTLSGAAGPDTYVFTATIAPANATPPVTYQWSPSPHSGQGTAVASYQWTTAGTYVITVTATNCGGPVVDTHTITIGASGCAHPLTDAAISGATSGYTGTAYSFSANVTPANATLPITYTWSPNPDSGQGSATASYQWSTIGVKTITLTAENCGGTADDTHLITIASPATATVRPLPDTTNGIHVFNDQLASSMSEEQFEFAAAHYAGTQKMTRADADHLRTYNPDFVILHYRLGMGLGYRAIQGTCEPTGDWLAIIEGDDWVQEWPGDANVLENWFYHWPEAGTTRVLNCDWGWYLMNPDNSSWRTFWSGEVLRQFQANDDDGLFADSFSVPNYLGFDRYDPNLPELDNTFESQWATRLENFMSYVQQGSLADYHFIPNAGQWVTSRETTDYSIADGVMIEGFGGWGYASYFELADWQLQMNRILGLVGQDKAILAQQYIDAGDVDDRMFLLGSYLLIKGRYTYINFELDLEPEWFPEYGIPIGSPTGGTPANIGALWNAGWGVYARTYSNGRVLVNPTAAAQTVNLGQTYYQATPNGGGFIPTDGDVSAWTVSYAPVTSVTLASNRAAVLLNTAP